MNGLRLALSFLTTLPVLSPNYVYEADHWRAAIFWFPLIGGLVGALVWLTGWGAGQIFSNWLAAGLAVVAWAVLTGGLHLDGLADCCDGLLASVDREQRLEILRDPHIGAFGAIGLVLFLGLKVGAVQGVLAVEQGVAIPAAAALGRTLIVWVARQPTARPGGMGAVFAAHIQLLTLFIISLLPAIGLLLFGWRGGLALLVAAAVTIGIIRLARRRIGGMTGDVYGLTVELVELSILLVFAAQSQR